MFEFHEEISGCHTDGQLNILLVQYLWNDSLSNGEMMEDLFFPLK